MGGTPHFSRVWIDGELRNFTVDEKHLGVDVIHCNKDSQWSGVCTGPA